MQQLLRCSNYFSKEMIVMTAVFKKKEDVRPYSVVVVPTGQEENRVRKQPDTSAANSAWLKADETKAVILEQPLAWTKKYPYENDGHLWVYIYASRAKGSGPDGRMDERKEVEVLGWTAAAQLDTNGTIKEWYLQPVDI
jgi:hypothetical protein